MDYPLLEHQLPSRIKHIWYKVEFISTASFLLVGALILAGLIGFDFYNDIWKWVAISYFILILISSLTSLLLIPYRYQFERYSITSDEVIFQKGFLFRSTTYVPINRIQHI